MGSERSDHVKTFPLLYTGVVHRLIPYFSTDLYTEGEKSLIYRPVDPGLDTYYLSSRPIFVVNM